MKTMYEELIKQLHWMEDVCKKDISCPVPCINECFFKEVADAIEELLWCINYMATCDNCKYFGGCCCDHVDADGNCLGWELLRKPTKEEKKRYEEYMAEAVRIAKQVLEEHKP